MREARRCQLKDLAKALKVSSAYLSALEHGHRGKPSPGLVQQVAAYFNLAWEQVDELKALAELSDPRVTIDTAGLTPGGDGAGQSAGGAHRCAERWRRSRGCWRC